MATPAQLAANRQNATRSTGPRTDAGKTSSSRNALKSGLYANALIIPGENPDDLDALRAEYLDEFTPQTPAERDLLDTLVHTEWLRRRIRLVEAASWNDYFARVQKSYDRDGLPFDETYALSHIYDSTGPRLDHIRRRLTSLDRTYHTTLADLRKLQAERARAAKSQAQPASAREPASREFKAPAQCSKPPIGFVSHPGALPGRADPAGEAAGCDFVPGRRGRLVLP